MRRIKLHLTGCGTVLTEIAEKKIESEEDYQIPKCNNGYTVDFYDDLGVNIPPELEEKLKKQDKGVKLEEEDFEKIYSNVSIYNTDILFKVTDEDITTIFVKGGYTLTVLETCDEIDDYEEYMNRNLLEKIRDFFLFIFSRKKKQTLEIE